MQSLSRGLSVLSDYHSVPRNQLVELLLSRYYINRAGLKTTRPNREYNKLCHLKCISNLSFHNQKKLRIILCITL